MRKYEFTGEEKEIFYSGKTVTLHRIRAVRSFGEITNIAWIKKIVIGFCTISVVLAVLQAFIWHI